ncbi:hypothetical protein JRG42_01100 [Pseudomonas granadensis]|uniref:Uncharacterized protein n=1 Tax=Pseudomonas granadensis TaxID=1421430 RepID=A0ABX7GGW8_9PSED|nr:hypothetical protein [Pseudomonas granadensis]MBN6772170.1 hypothetical protein [Pseudomonas granadensis]MBN6803054.1 hypothetical protein [Pseudomonas granadensis]MBN6830021.1 hypothetical protein [Pseudomonas granadensis]MBN6837275.1 hypothetical protein [Pseudomonas granadensis]MBN6865921.1 hypothetical protein [Pseudomonas granadensis]
MANQSADKSTSGDKAVTGVLDVKVNTEQKSLAAFQLIDILGSLVFQFGDASSTTGVVSTKFPKNEVGNELQHGAAGVDVSYSVEDKPVSWEGGKIKVAAKAGGGYEGTLQAVGPASGLSWTLSEGSFEITN